MLNLARYGAPGAARPVLLIHGLFGSGRNWGGIARQLSDRGEVLTVDMRNHGASFHATSQGYDDMAADLAEVIAAEGRPVDLVGHSMGGKAAMMLALERPELVRRLIVADIAPVAYAHSQAELIAAMRALDLTGLSSRSEAERRLAASIADERVRAFLLQSLDLRSEPPRWRLNLDVLDREMPRLTGWPEVSGRFEGATLFLSGAESDYVRSEHRDLILARFPAARLARIPGAGHWLHADRPQAFEAAVRAYLDAGGTGAD